jgi:hypothetical protein
MAHFKEEVVVIKISKLYKDKDTQKDLLSNEILENIETIVQEMVGDGALVEMERLNSE